MTGGSQSQGNHIEWATQSTDRAAHLLSGAAAKARFLVAHV
jgi:hypothetical protein